MFLVGVIPTVRTVGYKYAVRFAGLRIGSIAGLGPLVSDPVGSSGSFFEIFFNFDDSFFTIQTHL